MMAQLLRLVPLTLLVLLLAAPGRFAPGSDGPALLGHAPASALTLEGSRHPALPDPPADGLPASSLTPTRPASLARLAPRAPGRAPRLARRRSHKAPRAPPLDVLNRNPIPIVARTSCSDTRASGSFWRSSPVS